VEEEEPGHLEDVSVFQPGSSVVDSRSSSSSSLSSMSDSQEGEVDASKGYNLVN
jgi:hypothetical protein